MRPSMFRPMSRNGWPCGPTGRRTSTSAPLTWLKVAVKDLEALGARIEEGQVTPTSIDLARFSTDRALTAIEER